MYLVWQLLRPVHGLQVMDGAEEGADAAMEGQQLAMEPRADERSNSARIRVEGRWSNIFQNGQQTG